MGGILGGSGKTDRGNQLAATQGEWNIFNYGLPTGQAGQTSGTATLNTALNTLQQPIAYWQNLLQGGRTAAATNLAPQTQSVLDQANATRNQQAAFGTNRSGGASAQNRLADVQTQKAIDDIVTQGLVGGQAAGAAGLTSASAAQAGIGSTQLSNALSLLGLSQDSINAILNNATKSRQIDQSGLVSTLIGNVLGKLISKGIGLIPSSGGGGGTGGGGTSGASGYYSNASGPVSPTDFSTGTADSTISYPSDPGSADSGGEGDVPNPNAGGDEANIRKLLQQMLLNG